MTRRHFHAAGWLGTIVCAVSSDVASLAAEPARGFEPRPLAERLSKPVHATWRRASVAEIVVRLAADARIPIAIDRRIDFTRRLDVEGAGRPLDAVLDDVAQRAGAAAVLGRNGVRLAPPDAAARFAAADAASARRLARCPPEVRERLAAPAALVIEAGSTPREIVEALADAGGLAIDGIDRLPQDHLPAASFPAMPLADRLDLVLAHYDLRMEPDALRPSLAIVPLEPVPAGTARPPTLAQALARAGSPQDSAAVPIDRFTLRTAAPLDELLGVLARRFGLEADLDRASLAAKGVSAKEIVKLSVADASRDALLDAITRPLGLEWTIDAKRLSVR